MTGETRHPRWQQLGLELPLAPHFSRDDFLASESNAAALGMIETWPDWPESVLLLVGAAGSGKSHLATIWAQRAGAPVLAGADLAAADFGVLTQQPALAVDAADELGAAEASMFHLLNVARREKHSILLTARRGPDHWGLQLADLVSRLRLAPAARLGAPDDALLRSVLGKLFRDRQLRVDPAVIDFIALHIDRSLDMARAFVAHLDRMALARGSAVTRALVRDLLLDATGEAE